MSRSSEVGPGGGKSNRAAAPTRPLSSVLSAIEAGHRVPADIARETGLHPDVVRAAVEHLVRLGLAEGLGTTLCPAGGCGDCPAASAAGHMGPADCGVRPRPEAGAGPLRIRRRTSPGAS